MLPESIPSTGDCKIAIFGLNFRPGNAFRVMIGQRVIDDGKKEEINATKLLFYSRSYIYARTHTSTRSCTARAFSCKIHAHKLTHMHDIP